MVAEFLGAGRGSFIVAARRRVKARPFFRARSGQQLREFGSVHATDVLFGRKRARLVGDLAGGDVNALVRPARVPGRMEFAQRLDAGARKLPALAAEERNAGLPG